MAPFYISAPCLMTNKTPAHLPENSTALLTSTTQAKKQTRNTIAFKHMKRNAK
jgi:hypothetical protein